MYKKTKKLFATALMLTMLLTMVAFQGVASAATKTRLGGTNRYETAANVATSGWTTAATVVLVSGGSSADALVAGPLAKANDAPILLTDSKALSAATKTALTTLKTSKVIIVGGTIAVSADVENALKAMSITTDRVSGATRYATSVEVAKKLGTVTAVAIANAYAPADALSVSSIAAAKGMPILFTDKASLPKAVADYLATLTLTKTYVIGGTGVIADGVVAGATRLAGDNRYLTNCNVLKEFADLKYDTVYLATSQGADALTGSALAAKTSSPIVLVDKTFNATTLAYVAEKANSSTKVIALGGTTAVPEATVDSLITAINNAKLQVVSVKLVNAKELYVKFNKAVDDVTAGNATNYVLTKNNVSTELTKSVAIDSSDSTKVNITLDSALANGDRLTVKVLKSVLDTNLEAMDADYSETLDAFSDAVAPAFVSAKVSGSDVVVSFDDFIKTVGAAKIDGKVVSGTTTVSGKTVTISGGNSPALAVGTHTVMLYNVTDLLDNATNYVTGSFSVTTDATIPAYKSITAVNTNTFKVEFNKGLAVNPTFTVKKNGYTLTSTATPDANKLVYTVAVSDNGQIKVYDTNANTTALEVGITGIKDSLNNIGSPVTVNVTLTKDTTAPAILTGNSKVVAVDASNDSLNIQFAEPITLKSSTGIIVTKGGIRVTGFTTSIGDDSRYGVATVLKLTHTTLATGSYVVYLPADTVEDASTNPNAVANVTLTKSASSSSDITPVVTLSGNNITVAYGVDMTNTALAYNNYKLDGTTIPSGSILYFENDATTVVIELPASSVKYTQAYLLEISSNVVSTSGAKVSSSFSKVVSLTDNVKPTLLSAKKLTSTTVELTFDEALGTPASTWADDYVVNVNGVALDSTKASVVAGSDTTKLVLTVEAYNVDQTMTVTVGGSGITLNSADTTGNVITSGTTVTATK